MLMRLDETQVQAVERALREPVSIITGGPGTGKTTVCKELIRRLRDHGHTVICAAPTGKASHRFHEQTGYPSATIHRLLEWSPARHEFTRDNLNPLPADAVIIDEVSMVDVQLMASLIDAIADGSRLILVGDADQLPPVGPGSVLRDMVASGLFPTMRLGVVHRQSQSSWLYENANRILKYEPLYLEPTNNEDFFFMERPVPEEALQTIVNLVTKIIPRRHKLNAVDEVQVLCPMKKGLVGVHSLNDTLHAVLNPAQDGEPVLKVGSEEGDFFRAFRVGDKVMQMRNNYKIDVFNGEVGRIVFVDTREGVARVLFDVREVEYDYRALRDLHLCYASTVHKSQGSEYPCVILVVHNTHWPMLFRSLLYTGITRAKQAVYIVGDRKALHRGLNNDVPVTRRTSLQERLKAVLRDGEG